MLTGETLGRWLALAHAPGVGRRAATDLLRRFGSLDALRSASRAELLEATGGNERAADALRAPAAPELLNAVESWLASPDHHIISLLDADYPPLLAQVPDPPVLLYVIGRRALLAAPQLAIVGSRNPSPGGRENARMFAHALSEAGLAITSGLALGIDGAAHAGALDAGGMTVAVAGTGIDRVYPARHRELAHRIAGSGALVSEFPLGTPPRREHFPQRNRIISGLALGTLVVEAAVQSGSLITARFAGEQGREVFAIPGSIHSPLARGCHALIRQGAKLVETAQDILEELGVLAEFAAHSAVTSYEARCSDAGEAGALLEHVGFDPVSVDTLVERSGLTAEAISSMLLELELHGLVDACPGGRYQRAVGS